MSFSIFGVGLGNVVNPVDRQIRRLVRLYKPKCTVTASLTPGFSQVRDLMTEGIGFQSLTSGSNKGIRPAGAGLRPVSHFSGL